MILKYRLKFNHFFDCTDIQYINYNLLYIGFAIKKYFIGCTYLLLKISSYRALKDKNYL